MDQNIWENARSYSRNRKAGAWGEIYCLPVVNKEGYLVSFAWYDMDANRELRQLRELSECAGAYQFKDVFPQYDCVTIHEFNELAFFFAKYLTQQGIPVIVEGILWEGFFESTGQETLEYRTLHIFAEGIVQKEKNWIKNILRSASVEFECVDTIYEKNIGDGIIKDADGNEEILLKKLQAAGAIVITGTGTKAVEAYDYLLSKGLDILGFVSGDVNEKRHTLFGKKILNVHDVHICGQDVIWINPSEKGSAWKGADSFDYLGYRRNERYFMLRDYAEPECDGLSHILKGHRVICMGEPLICCKLIQELESNPQLYGSLFEYAETVDESTIDEETFILFVFPLDLGIDIEQRIEKNKQRQQTILENLYAHGILHFSDYFSGMHGFISALRENREILSLKPKQVIVGATEAGCGNIFIRELLDGHPNIFMIHYGVLNRDLFWICMMLSTVEIKKISLVFWQMIQGWSISEEKRSEMREIVLRLQDLLERQKKETVSSLELFIMLHMANQYATYGESTDISEFTIYWEPHMLQRDQAGELTKWFEYGEIHCSIYYMVRNVVSKKGACLKHIFNGNLNNDINGKMQILYIDAYAPVKGKLLFKNGLKASADIVIVRFEDMKLRPEEELKRLCKAWGIDWSESLLKPSRFGKSFGYVNDKGLMATGFDCTPVYNNYEVYFSELDRLRIMLVCSVWQKRFGYPYVELDDFTRRDLQELFLKPFRLEKWVERCSEKERIIFQIKRISRIRYELQEVRRLGSYYKNIDSRKEE